jgi:hypothetical protein
MHRWLARYEGDGLEGLNDRSHRPAHSPHQIPAVLEAMVLEMRRLAFGAETQGRRKPQPQQACARERGA